jgi:hypothetical protein
VFHVQLSPGEQSILAYFPSSAKAQEAAGALKSIGIGEVQVDRVSRYGVARNRELNNPVAGQAETITGLTLYSSDTDRFDNNDARTLMASDPSVSGMADGTDEALREPRSFLLTVVTSADRVDEAMRILKEKKAYF